MTERNLVAVSVKHTLYDAPMGKNGSSVCRLFFGDNAEPKTKNAEVEG